MPPQVMGTQFDIDHYPHFFTIDKAATQEIAKNCSLLAIFLDFVYEVNLTNIFCRT